MAGFVAAAGRVARPLASTSGRTSTHTAHSACGHSARGTGGARRDHPLEPDSTLPVHFESLMPALV